MYTVVFFGSFQNYSNQVLTKLLEHPEIFKVTGVVTTPPRPAGRNQILAPTPTQTMAEQKKIPVFPLESLDDSTFVNLKSLRGIPDFLLVAGYGKLIPQNWLGFPKIAPINVHLSYLPEYPGRFPAEWAILMDERQTGVTLIKMSSEFDKGEIITQERLPINTSDTRKTLYTKLYNLGADMIIRDIPAFAQGKIISKTQDRPTPPKYARQISREDGFVPWGTLKSATIGQPIVPQDLHLFAEVSDFKKIKQINSAEFVYRMLRAFDPWPGVWTTTPDNRRLKIIKGTLENDRLVVTQIQFEGKNPQTTPPNLIAPPPLTKVILMI